MIELIVNCETGETVERELTPEEIAQREIDAAAFAAEQAAAEAEAADKATKRAAVLQALAAAAGLDPAEVENALA